MTVISCTILANGHVSVPGLEGLVGDDADVLSAPPLRLEVAVQVAGGEVGERGHLRYMCSIPLKGED